MALYVLSRLHASIMQWRNRLGTFIMRAYDNTEGGRLIVDVSNATGLFT